MNIFKKNCEVELRRRTFKQMLFSIVADLVEPVDVRCGPVSKLSANV